MDSTITGTEKTMWVRIISHMPELTKFKPLDPQSSRTDRPRDEVGMIKGIFSMDLMKRPYHLLLMMKANGIAIHMETYVEVRATIIEVRVARVM
jgi:hypothetical protein